MTGFLHEKEFSRQSFLKGGGAMIVGLSLAGTAGKASAAGIDAFASPGPANPNGVDSFLTIHADNTASLNSGRIELGQGATVGLMMIAAEELDMDVSQMQHIAFDTGGPTPSPNTGNTGGSTSISQGGPLVRKAAAEARQALNNLASAALGVPVGSLTVSKGVVSGGGKTTTWGALLGGKLFNVTYTGTTLNTGQASPGAGQASAKPVSQYTQVGIARPNRYDIPDIVSGKKTYAANVRVPGMLHGRIVRPRGQGAYGDGINPVPLSIDANSISHLKDVQIVHIGNFLGVVAPKEYDAIQAAAQLKVAWSDPPKIYPVGNLWAGMRAQDAAGTAPARIAAQTLATGVSSIDAAMASAAKTYSRHVQVPLPDARADRPERRSRGRHDQRRDHLQPRQERVRRDAVAGGRSAELGRDHGEAPEHVRHQQSPRCLLRGLEHVRWRCRSRRQRRERGDHVDGRRRPSSRPVDALGRARLGQLRPGDDVGRQGRHRRERQSRRVGCDEHGHGLLHEDTVRSGGRPADPDTGCRPRRHHLFGNAVQHPEPADHRQDGAHLEQLLQGEHASCTQRTADHLRERAGHRPPRVPGGDGPVRVPPEEHPGGAGQRRVQPVARCTGRGWQGFQLAAEGVQLGEADRRYPQRPRHRDGRLRQLAGCERGRHRGEREDRQDRRQAPVRGGRRRHHGCSGSGREQHVRRPDHGRKPGSHRGSHVQRGPGHEPRLGLVSAPALQGSPGSDDAGRSAHRPAGNRQRRAAHGRCCCINRQRVLRRDGCSPHRSTDDARRAFARR